MVAWQGGNQTRGSLVDILDKVLDKGLVIAGDIRVEVANVELLNIKIRLLVCSVDKAQEIGLDWWRSDGFLSSGAEKEMAGLRARIEALEQQLALPGGTNTATDETTRPRRRGGRRPKQDA